MDLPFLTAFGPDEICEAGVPGRWSYGFRDQVRFSEIDRLNHVNNVAYLQWFEVARVQYFVAWGLTKYRDDDPQLVVRKQTADYLAPMHLGEDYLIACRTSRIGKSSFTMEYLCWSGNVRATGSSVMVLLEPDGSGKRLLPNDVVSRFREIDGISEA